jgi:hypothetical protein
MQDSLSQLASSVDSLRATVVALKSPGFGEYILVISGVAALLWSIWIHYSNRQNERKRANELYAVIWGAVMTEVGRALGRMREQTMVYSKDNRQVNMLLIELTDGLQSSYLPISRHPKVSSEITALYINIIHYRDAYRDAVEFIRNFNPIMTDSQAADFRLKKLNLLETPMWISRSRHLAMVESFNRCLEQFESFLKKEKIKIDFHLDKAVPIDEEYRLIEGEGDTTNVLRC